MPPAFVVAACVAAALFVSPDGLRSALATSAATLFEAVPFLLAGWALSRVLRSAAAISFLGCGCGSGPAARSLPAAAATSIVFGPWVAIARWTAAVAAGQVIRRRGGKPGECSREASDADADGLLPNLASLLPSALAAGAFMQLLAGADLSRLPALLTLLAGASLAFVSSPCGLGAAAVAASLHVRAPLAADAYLCVAGIVDARAFRRLREHARGAHDVFGYAVAALAMAAVAARHGAALVHPALGVPLAISCIIVLALGTAHRRQRATGLALAPFLMLAGVLVTAPAPVYRATETTMADLFVGERLSFTGTLSVDGAGAAIVRYAITCCRADAAPVAVRLSLVPAYSSGTWLHVDGVVERRFGAMRLNAQRVMRVAPPTDPFVYR